MSRTAMVRCLHRQRYRLGTGVAYRYTCSVAELSVLVHIL